MVAHTLLVKRTVIELPLGLALDPEDDMDSLTRPSGPTEPEAFWAEFLTGLVLDDPNQPIPKPVNRGNLTFSLPIPGGTAWLTVYRNATRPLVRVFYGYRRGTIGEEIARRLHADFDELKEQLGTVGVHETDGKIFIDDTLDVASLTDPAARAAAFEWLRVRTNEFLNVLRPRVRALVAELDT